ncbi:protein eva-1 homolog C-like isoform X2 [Ambystoma mexicanum]|uniref:protein eva-1 homolog C-like isoform X2 n=1 Tax=Ambystoma mexicanum TaxID=8296 RepID=UPI0037E8AC3A
MTGAPWHRPCSHGMGLLAVVGVLCLPSASSSAPEFSDYLQKVLKNHTANGCDGGQLGITCPHKTSISVLSAFYGRRVPSQNLCPGPASNTSEDTFCSSPVAVQKVLDECQDQRFCQFSVNSRMFGMDPCPETSKYLIVSYKCKPDNHRVKTACEDDKLRLHCRNTSVLAIYSASYGRTLRGSADCASSGPDIECLAPVALRKVSRKCHGKQNCTILADTASFGDPCFPGIRKELSVSYTCVPKQLLEEVARDSPDPFSLSDYTHGLPEKVGLYFLCGVSVGLVFLLCIVTPKMAFLQEVQKVFLDSELGSSMELGGLKRRHGSEDEDVNHYDSSSDSSFRRLTRSYYTSNNIFSPELTAALEEAADPGGAAKDDIWIPKESSPYAISKIKSATK